MQALTPSPGRERLWAETYIAFNHGQGGLRFRDVQQGDPRALHGWDDFAFRYAPLDRAEFRILWPGYGHMDRTFSIPTTANGRPITLWQMAWHVVRYYTLFCEDARRSQVSRGNEPWDIHRFKVEDFVLVSVSNNAGHDAVFQAVIDAAYRPKSD